LLDGRSDPNARDHGGGRALMMAAWVGSEEIAAMLLKAGARIDQVDDRKWSALMMAAERGHAKCLESLAACGADLALVCDTGETAEQIARRKGRLECAGILSTQSEKAKIASGIGAASIAGSRVGLRI
jgi:ankyrin repeat protein